MDARVSVVIATRDRVTELLGTLGRLRDLPEQPRIVVVDNGSTDGTPRAVFERYPDVQVIALSENRGSGARTLGVRQAETPYVAFSDDDSWWDPGALGRAADLFDRHPRLAVLAARVLVGPEGRLDPVCTAMAATPLPPEDDLPGKPVLGFIACGSVVRREPFLSVGGFDGHFGIGGEEELLALDLAAAGWGLAYVPEVVARHFPSQQRDRPTRRRTQMRNALWSAWLRRRPRVVFRETARGLALAWHDPAGRAAFGEAVRGLPWVIRHRHPVPPAVESALRKLGH